jgi:peptidoglycan hydrolase CwlO-like protein
MSSSRGKKVHYERGTKGEKSHRHTSSRDSGVGSSSASDRASLGTSPLDESPFNYRQIQDQRLSVTALQEALDAANDKIRQLQGDNAKLNSTLAESNKENRAFKKERLELLNKIDDLIDDLEYEKKANEKFRRESSPRTSAAAPSKTSKTERRTTPPRAEPRPASSRRESADPRPSRRDEERSERSEKSERSAGSYGRTTYVPTATQGPPSQNPFMPLPTNPARTPSVSYAPSAVTYAPAPVSYTTSPIYTSPPPSATSSRFPNDGLYHPYPLDERR